MDQGLLRLSQFRKGLTVRHLYDISKAFVLDLIVIYLVVIGLVVILGRFMPSTLEVEIFDFLFEHFLSQ